MMEVLSGRRPAPPPSQPPSSQVLVTGPQRATSESIPEDEEVDGDDMYQALDETDHRNFKLVDNKTPFENHGMQAWDEWDGRKKIPNQFKSPKETKSYMGGKSFFIDERGVGHVDFKEASDDYTAKLREHRDKWDSRRATGYVGAPDAPTEEDERKQLDKDFLTEQRRAHEKVLQQLAHQIYIAPNAIWARRSYDHLRRALTHKPI